MRELHRLSIVVLLSGLGVLCGCGSLNPPPVKAQTLSISSLSGTYIFQLSGHGDQTVSVSVPPFGNGAGAMNIPVVNPQTIYGTMVLDGAGHITSGSMTVVAQQYVVTSPGMASQSVTVQDNQCTATLTGTYTVNSNATGSISLSPVVVGTCSVIQSGGTATFQTMVAGQGSGGTMFSYSTGAPSSFGSVFAGTFAVE